MNVRALVAEFIGTFVLVFFGSLGASTAFVLTQGQGSPIATLLIVPFAFAFGLMAAIAIAGPTSGGHFNPAVTLGALLDGRIGWVDAIGYAFAQVFGAILASLTILLIISVEAVKATLNAPGQIASDQLTAEVHAFAVEVLLTAIFVAVILTVTRKAGSQAVFVIPLTLAAIHFAGIYISGASVNPARSLGPAVVSGTYDSLWIYLTAPFVGALIGWGVYRLLLVDEADDVDVDDELEDDELDDLDDDLDDARA